MAAGRRKMITAVQHGPVACQARGDHSPRSPSTLAALARCVERAAAIRADGPDDVTRTN